MKTPSPNHCTASTVPPDAIWRNWYLKCLALGTWIWSWGCFLPPMPAVPGLSVAFTQNCLTLRTRADPPHHSRYSSNSTALLCPQSFSVPFLLQCPYWNMLASHLSPLQASTDCQQFPKLTQLFWFPSSCSFSCRSLACITVSWGTLGVGAHSFDSAQGNSRILYPHWHCITVSP